jgi:hypothetical protein
LSRVADHDRANGSKKIVFHCLFPSFVSARIDSQQFPAHDCAVLGFETARKVLDKIVDFETGVFFTCRVADSEAQDQERAGDRSAVSSHAHARAEGAAQLKGCIAIQAVLLAETGKDGLRSCVTLLKKGQCGFHFLHEKSLRKRQHFDMGGVQIQQNQESVFCAIEDFRPAPSGPIRGTEE